MPHSQISVPPNGYQGEQHKKLPFKILPCSMNISYDVKSKKKFRAGQNLPTTTSRYRSSWSK